MTSTYASIYDSITGETICSGLQPSRISDQAIQTARRTAADLGQTVRVVDGDDEYDVTPDGEIVRA